MLSRVVGAEQFFGASSYRFWIMTGENSEIEACFSTAVILAYSLLSLMMLVFVITTRGRSMSWSEASLGVLRNR